MRTQLLPHNRIAYRKVMESFGKTDRTCVVHPTGTGKSYLIAAVSEDFKKVLILGPNTFVLDQVHQVLAWRDKDGDGTVEYMTYSMLLMKDSMPTGYDLICLDEFHRAGAPNWGIAVDEILKANSQAKVFGTSATPIRYLDSERNMADEIFHNNVASHIGIGEAWSRNILPVPRFVIGIFNFHKTIEEAECRINESKKLSPDEKRRRIFKLSNARLEWEQSMGMPQILRRHLDPDIRRIIIFCSDIARLESMRETVIGWFRMAGFTVKSACTVHIGQTDRQLREAMDEFGSNEGEGVRLMFSVNMLNEGVHIPRVGAVLMLRTTASRIIYMQQMGRCLTAANTEKPVILDMVDNITTTSAIHGLRDDFIGWERFYNGDLSGKDRRFQITDYRQSIRDVLKKLSPLELSFESWEEKLQLLLDFCEKKGRTPSYNDGEIFRKYMYLMSNYRETEEMKFIVQKYARAIYWNDQNKDFILHELREFIDTRHRAPSRWIVEEVRWYNMLKGIMKHEPSHPIVLEFNRLEEQRNKEEKERHYDESKGILSAFLEREGRLPNCKPLEDGTYEPYRKWAWLREYYPDDPFVKEVREKYSRHKVTCKEVLPLEKRIDICESICKEHGRQPHASYDDQTAVRSWTYLKRHHGDHPRVRELMKYPVLHINHKRIECGIKKVEEFYDKHGRLPYSRSNGQEEKQALNSMQNIFEKYPDEPRVKVLMEKKPKRSMALENAIHRILEFEKITGRLPTMSMDKEGYTWRNLVEKHPDEPEVKELMEKYVGPYGCSWTSSKEERETARLALRKIKTAKYHYRKLEKDLESVRAFAEKNGRLPRRNSTTPREEELVYYALRNLKKNHSGHPDVIKLLSDYPRVTATLDDGIQLLQAFVEKEHRLPRDTRGASSEERRVISTWKVLKSNYPDHPVTKRLLEEYPYGTTKLSLAIQSLVEFERKYHRLPTTRNNGIEGESKVYEKLADLRKDHADHPVVKEILERYKDLDPKLEITRETVAFIAKWADEHGRLPKNTKLDKEERRMYYSLKHQKRHNPDLPELKALLDKYK